MRLKYSFRKNIQQQFSHHSFTIQDVMQLAFTCITLSFEVLHLPDFSFMGETFTKAHKKPAQTYSEVDVTLAISGLDPH